MGSDFVSALFYCFSKSPFCPETALAITSRACRPVAGFQCWVPADRRHRRNGLPTVTAAGGNGELRHVLAPKRARSIGSVFQKERRQRWDFFLFSWDISVGTSRQLFECFFLNFIGHHTLHFWYLCDFRTSPCHWINGRSSLTPFWRKGKLWSNIRN